MIFLYQVARWIFQFAFALLSHRDIRGVENIPSAPPYIVVANHLSYVDAPLLYTILKVKRVTGWAAEKYQSHPFYGPFVNFFGGVFIQRGKVDRKAIAAAIDRLQNGYVFGVAPEGTRSHTGTLARGKTGAAYLANEADVPILPFALSGTDKAFSDLMHFRRPHLSVRIGEPFRLPPIHEETRSTDLRRNTDEIMCRIAAMLPSSYRGVYADHPRLTEFLDDTTT
jgi:1-acyl-sn-glycerol-3-phosphate acyltransferase